MNLLLCCGDNNFQITFHSVFSNFFQSQILFWVCLQFKGLWAVGLIMFELFLLCFAIHSITFVANFIAFFIFDLLPHTMHNVVACKTASYSRQYTYVAVCHFSVQYCVNNLYIFVSRCSLHTEIW